MKEVFKINHQYHRASFVRQQRSFLISWYFRVVEAYRPDPYHLTLAPFTSEQLQYLYVERFSYQTCYLFHYDCQIPFVKNVRIRRQKQNLIFAFSFVCFRKSLSFLFQIFVFYWVSLSFIFNYAICLPKKLRSIFRWKSNWKKSKQIFLICWFVDLIDENSFKFIDLILFIDLNLKYFRSKIERENFLSTCQIFHYYDFFRLIRIQSSMMSVIKKWNWKDFDYFLIRVKFFTIVIFSLFQSKQYLVL